MAAPRVRAAALRLAMKDVERYAGLQAISGGGWHLVFHGEPVGTAVGFTGSPH